MGFWSKVFSGSPVINSPKSITSHRRSPTDGEQDESAKPKPKPKEVQEIEKEDSDGCVDQDELEVYMDKLPGLWAMLSAHCNISKLECREIARDTARRMAKVHSLGPDAVFEDLHGVDLDREPTASEFAAFHTKLQQDPDYDLQFYHRIIFHTFDSDNDGLIKEDEIGDYVKLFYDIKYDYSKDLEVELPPKEELTLRMLYHFDTNHDGGLDFYEFEPLFQGGPGAVAEVLEDKEARSMFEQKRKSDQQLRKSKKEKEGKGKQFQREDGLEKKQLKREVASSSPLQELFTSSAGDEQAAPPPPPQEETPTTHHRKSLKKSPKRSPKKSKQSFTLDDKEKENEESYEQEEAPPPPPPEETPTKQHRKSPKKSPKKSPTKSKKAPTPEKENEEANGEAFRNSLRSSSKKRDRRSESRKGLCSSATSNGNIDHDGLRSSTSSKAGRDKSQRRSSMRSERDEHGEGELRSSTSSKGKRRSSMSDSKTNRDDIDSGLLVGTKREDTRGDAGLRGSARRKQNDSQFRGSGSKEVGNRSMRSSTNSKGGNRSPRTKSRKSRVEDDR